MIFISLIIIYIPLHYVKISFKLENMIPLFRYLLSRLNDIVKPLLLDFVSDMRSLKFGIQLMVPKVEDGNNFGVQIQESVIKAIGQAERQSLSRLNQFSNYYKFRGS